MDLTKLLEILLIIVLAPLSYVYYFLIVHLKAKLGLLKYCLLLLCYIIAWMITVFILTAGLINLLVFVLIHLIILFVGVWNEREEFIKSIMLLLRK